jgi:hypothetical protein
MMLLPGYILYGKYLDKIPSSIELAVSGEKRAGLLCRLLSRTWTRHPVIPYPEKKKPSRAIPYPDRIIFGFRVRDERLSVVYSVFVQCVQYSVRLPYPCFGFCWPGKYRSSLLAHHSLFFYCSLNPDNASQIIFVNGALEWFDQLVP